jgi:hypothetical protein
VGTITGLLHLYDQLQRLFRDTIAPSGGNNYAIQTSLNDLLYHAHLCALSSDEYADFWIDIMDFIFDEMHAAWLGWVTLPYTPYIMLLMKHVVQGLDLPGDVDHKAKRPYIKRKGAGAAPAACLDTFMRDARSNTFSNAQSAADRAASREFKQLLWFQKNILCKNVDIHRENYQVYVERKAIIHTQQQILHHVSGSQSNAPTTTPATAYS